MPRTKEEREERYRFEHRIVLNVMVTDRNGDPVRGLQPEDFAVIDREQRQSLSTFRSNTGTEAGAHAHVVVVLDAINSSSRTLESARRGIAKFLSQGHEPLPNPVSIVLVDSKGNREIDQSTDRDALARGLAGAMRDFHRTECDSSNPDADIRFHAAIVGSASAASRVAGISGADAQCLNERFQESVAALRMLAQKQLDAPGHAILVWTGPGWPLLVGPEFLPDTASMRHRDFAYLVELCRMLREGQVTLDAVLTYDPERSAEMRAVGKYVLFEGTPTADVASAASLGLPPLAHQTGGLVMENTEDIAGALARSVGELDSYYMLAFSSTPTSKIDEYHRLEVKVERPGVKVRTSTSYYDQP